MEEYTISKSEWQILRVLWANPNSRSQDIIRHLKDHFSWQPSTVKTLLNRLKSKGFVGMTKIEGKYHYQALISEEEQIQKQWDVLLSNVCNRKHGVLLIQLLETSDLSVKDLELLSKKLQVLKQHAPKVIFCDCIEGQCSCEDVR